MSISCLQGVSHPHSSNSSVDPKILVMNAGACLEQDLDENSAAGSGVVLCDANCVEHGPADGVCGKQVGEEFGHVAQFVGL